MATRLRTDNRLEPRCYVTPAVIAPSGNPSNHHTEADGSIGNRVTLETATHLIVTNVAVLSLADLNGATSFREPE